MAVLETCNVVDELLDPAQVLWRNLCLLGIHEAQCLTDSLRNHLAPDMFARGSNHKAQNIVLYFLLHRLDPAQSSKNFAGLWPILDQKQDQEFRNTCFKVLSDLGGEGGLPRAIIQRSHLNFGFGKRLINLVWHLSRYVLQEVFKREFPSAFAALVCPIPDPASMPISLLHAHIAALEERLIENSEDLLDHLQENADMLSSLQDMIGVLSEDYRNSFRQQQLKLKEVAEFDRVTDRSSFSEMMNVERLEQAEHMGCTWQKISDVLCDFRRRSECLDLVLNDASSGFSNCISKDALVKASRSFLSAAEDFDLVFVMDYFGDLIEELSRQLVASEHSISCEELDQDYQRMTHHLSSQSSHLQIINELIVSLTSTNALIKDEVVELQKQIHVHSTAVEPSHPSTIASPDANQMRLIPPTPQTVQPGSTVFMTPKGAPVAPLARITEDVVKHIDFSGGRHNNLVIRQPMPRCPLPLTFTPRKPATGRL